MKIKIYGSIDFAREFLNKIILDVEDEEGEDLESSKLLFFAKDIFPESDDNNKMSLIIVDKENGYVVHNDLRFEYVSINKRKIVIHSIIDNKKEKYVYWFK